MYQYITKPGYILSIQESEFQSLGLLTLEENEIENPEINLEYSRRGWMIASVGLLFSFNIFIAGPLGLIGILDIGCILFLVWIGTPIALAGLIISIGDKWGVGQKNILAEIIVLILLSMNAFVFASMGTIGV